MNYDLAQLYDAAAAAFARVMSGGSTPPGLNEAETRFHLIDPIIEALGYKTLDAVRREHHLRASGQVVDYLLHASDRKIVVEAKAIRHELGSKDASQLVGYCAQEGIRWALLTNGARWQLFDVEVSGNWEAKRVADIDVLRAWQEEQLGDVLKPLALFAQTDLAADDSDLLQWVLEHRARQHLAALIESRDSPVVAAAIQELDQAGVHLEADEVVALLRGTVRAQHPVRVAQQQAPQQVKQGGSRDEPANYLFPAGPKAGHDGLAHLRSWLERGFWGIGASTAHRQAIKRGDQCCFYATGIGVVAHARVAGPVNMIVQEKEWPGLGEYSREVYRVPLEEIVWLDPSRPITREIRAQLEAFAGKNLDRPWSWLVQTTKRLSAKDYDLLAGESAPTSPT